MERKRNLNNKKIIALIIILVALAAAGLWAMRGYWYGYSDGIKTGEVKQAIEDFKLDNKEKVQEAIKILKNIKDKHHSKQIIDAFKNISNGWEINKKNMEKNHGKKELELFQTQLSKMAILIKVMSQIGGKEVKTEIKKYINDPYLGRTAQRALGKIGDKNDLDEMIKKLGREKVDVSGFSVAAINKLEEIAEKPGSKESWGDIGQQLSYIRDPAAIPRLKELLNNKNEYIVQGAAQALGHMLGPNDKELIKTKVKDYSLPWYVRIEFLKSILYQNDKELDNLLLDVIQNDPERVMRGVACDIIERKRLTEAIPILKKVAETDEYVGSSAYGALYEITKDRNYLILSQKRSKEIVDKRKKEKAKIKREEYEIAKKRIEEYEKSLSRQTNTAIEKRNNEITRESVYKLDKKFVQDYENTMDMNNEK